MLIGGEELYRKNRNWYKYFVEDMKALSLLGVELNGRRQKIFWIFRVEKETEIKADAVKKKKKM